MKDYKVKALRNFTDGLENVKRKQNDIFECDKERYEYLKNKKAVELVEVQETIDTVIEKEVTEEEVQAVANAIVLEAEEQNKNIEEIVNEIVEEQKEDEVIEQAIIKKKKSRKK